MDIGSLVVDPLAECALVVGTLVVSALVRHGVMNIHIARRRGGRVMNRNTRIATFASLLLIGSIAVDVVAGWGHAQWWLFGLMVVAVMASEAAEFRIVVGKQVWTLAFTEVLLGCAFVLAPGGWLAPACALAVGLLMVIQRDGRVKVLFNVAQFGFATSLAALVSHAFGGSIIGAALALLVFSAANQVLVLIVISLASGRSVRELMQLGRLVAVATSLGNASVGLLGGWLAGHAPIGLLGLLVPMWLVWHSYHLQVRQAAETKMFAELVAVQERVSGPSADTSSRVIVRAAQRLLDGEIELVLLTDEVPVRYWTDGDNLTCQREPERLSDPWVVEALGANGIVTGVADGAPYLLSRLGSATGPTAVLRAARPANSVNFERRDQMMATILFRQAESWLAMVELSDERDEAVARAEMSDAASRVIGDMGAETFPALVRLRESAVRLTRLANTATSREGVGDIVEELHAAERAVASLLGAIAMAADTQLAGDVIELPAGSSMGENDWTTTGTLELEVADGAS